MYTALYRTYRPETFDELLGQDHIVRILKNQLETDTVSHAYLFCGTRGTGKTTTARLLAKGVNCTSDGERPCGKCSSCQSIREGTFIDVIEIDAASNNGVDNIRELRESVKYPPAAGRKKVYIVDEVHMLTAGAFNALLKTLEEPPESVMFILATTEPQKLPATILSRCMKLDFKRVPENILVQGMAKICEGEGVRVADSALKLIAANADGSVRDGLSILDQCISAGQLEVTRDDVLEFLGTSGEDVFIELTDLVKLGNVAEALLLVDRVLADGKDVRRFFKDWLAHYRNLLISKFVRDPEEMLNMSCENIERVKAQSDTLDLSVINSGILELSKMISEAKWSTQPRILLELCVVKMASHGGPGAVSPKTVSRPAAEKTVERSVKTVGKSKMTDTPEETATESAEEVPVEGQKTSDSADEKTEAQTAEEVEATEVPETENFDLGELWHTVFEEAEAYKGSFNLIRTGSQLIDMEKDIFTVSATNSMIKDYAENNRDILEDLMEKHTGKRRGLKCILIDEEPQKTPKKTKETKEKKDPEKVAASVADFFGSDVKIEIE